MRRHPGAADVAARERKPARNRTDPRGQFGEFLRAWLDQHHGGDETVLSDALGVSDRTIRKWCEGTHGPGFHDLERIAVAMGFADWTDLAIAIRKLSRKS